MPPKTAPSSCRASAGCRLKPFSISLVLFSCRAFVQPCLGVAGGAGLLLLAHPTNLNVSVCTMYMSVPSCPLCGQRTKDWLKSLGRVSMSSCLALGSLRLGPPPGARAGGAGGSPSAALYACSVPDTLTMMEERLPSVDEPSEGKRDNRINQSRGILQGEEEQHVANLEEDGSRTPGSARAESIRSISRHPRPAQASSQQSRRTSCFVAGIFAMNCSYAVKPEMGLPFHTMREFGVYRLDSVGRSLSHAV